MKLIVSNWKMNGTLKQINEYFETFLSNFKSSQNHIIFSLPYIFLHYLVEKVKKYKIDIFAQNCHFEDEGAFTGEISAKMLSSIGVKGSIVGHFERRQFGENYQLVNKKVRSLINNNLIPIICIGETSEEKSKRNMILNSQISESLNGISNNKNIIIAYEPIWAIGKKESMNVDIINDSINIIREKCLKLNFENIKIIYGGSVSKNNITEILSCENVDGVLIGRASLDPNFIVSIA